MKNIILATAMVLVTATAAMADASNGIPSPYGSNKSRATSPIIGNSNGWINERLRFIPQVIAEPQSFSTRKYGTPVGHCKPIKRSSGGKLGRFLGWGYASTCR